MYASLDAATVWAEWSAATRGAIDPANERRSLWPIEIRDLPVVDLRRPETREELGVTLEELSGPRHAAQQLAPRARELGALGIVAPSAARADAWNVVVFPEGFDHVAAGRRRNMHPRPPRD